MKNRKLSLHGKVYIITGASSGIGKACARQILEHGGRVCIVARSEMVLDNIFDGVDKKVLNNVLICRADVTNSDECEHVINKVLVKFNHVDGLINNAGIGLFKKSWETSVDEYKLLLDTNLFGAVRIISEVLPHFLSKKSGHIINIASVAARRAFPNAAGYCASKFALRGYSESLRQELSMTDTNIQVSIVYPVATRTLFFQKAGYPDFESSHRHTVIMDPIDVASQIMKIIYKGKGDLILSQRAKIIDKVHFLFPNFVEKMSQKAYKSATEE